MGTELKLEHEVHEVVSWRRDQLARAGFTLAVAASLASDPRYDVHALLELIDRGCSPELAIRIMAPLEERDTA